MTTAKPRNFQSVRPKVMIVIRGYRQLFYESGALKERSERASTQQPQNKGPSLGVVSRMSREGSKNCQINLSSGVDIIVLFVKAGTGVGRDGRG